MLSLDIVDYIGEFCNPMYSYILGYAFDHYRPLPLDILYGYADYETYQWAVKLGLKKRCPDAIVKYKNYNLLLKIPDDYTEYYIKYNTILIPFKSRYDKTLIAMYCIKYNNFELFISYNCNSVESLIDYAFKLERVDILKNYGHAACHALVKNYTFDKFIHYKDMVDNNILHNIVPFYATMEHVRLLDIKLYNKHYSTDSLDIFKEVHRLYQNIDRHTIEYHQRYNPDIYEYIQGL